eukprot:gene4145-6502_t
MAGDKDFNIDSVAQKRGSYLLHFWRISLASFIVLPAFLYLRFWILSIFAIFCFFSPVIFAKKWVHFAYEEPPRNIEILFHSAIGSFVRLFSPGLKQPKLTCSSRIRANAAEFKEYCKLCGFKEATFENPGLAALPFMHAMSIAICGSIVAHPAFPYSALGLIHIRNHIGMKRKVRHAVFLASRVLQFSYTKTDKGVEILFLISAFDDKSNELLFNGSSTLLHRCKTDIARPRKIQQLEDNTPSLSEEWTLPGTIGLSYAICSGDYNPIHLHPISAKAFGQKNAIAHGMYTLAKSLSSAASLVKSDFDMLFPLEVTNEWKLPLHLPSNDASYHCNVVTKHSGHACGSSPRSIENEPLTPTEYVSFAVRFEGSKPHMIGALWHP